MTENIAAENSVNYEAIEKPKKTLTKKDLFWFWFLQHFFQKAAESISYYYANGICASMIGCLRKLYAGDDQGLEEALLRHLEVYISEGNVGSIILGATIAMEEEKANGAPIDGSIITTFKTSVMGPVAGIGDTLNGYVIAPIWTSICASFGMSGSYICLLAPMNSVFYMILSWWLFNTGYKGGRSAVLKVLKGDWLDKFVYGAGILGMLMMGCLGAQYVKIAPSLVLTMNAGNTVDFAKIFDSVIPGLCPFLFIICGYMYLDKGKKASSTKLMVWYFIIVAIGCLIKFW